MEVCCGEGQGRWTKADAIDVRPGVVAGGASRGGWTKVKVASQKGGLCLLHKLGLLSNLRCRIQLRRGGDVRRDIDGEDIIERLNHRRHLRRGGMWQVLRHGL